MQSESSKRRPPHMNGKQVVATETLICEECRKRGVVCGGVWRFHSQHGKHLLQCRTCRQKRRGCSFRKLENDGKPLADHGKQNDTIKVGKRRRSPSVISISDSEGSSEGNQVAGPSSRPEKKIKVEGGEKWDRLEKTLLVARKQKVEIETVAEVRLARVNMIIEGVMRELKGGEQWQDV